MTLTGIKAFFSKLWEAIKKVPHWALIALLLLGSIVYSLLRKSADQKKLLLIQKTISRVEKERAEHVANINETNIEEEKTIKESFDNKLTLLREEEKHLHEAEVEGPVAIAKEWSDFLLKRDKE